MASSTSTWTITSDSGQVYSPSSSSSAPATKSGVRPLYSPVTIALCNGGAGNVSVADYNSTDNGRVTLFCGTDLSGEGSGYVHIRYRHQKDFQKILDTYPIGGNWDDLSEYMTKASLEHPSSGYSKSEPNQKRCYSAAFKIAKDGVTVKTYHPTVIISANNKLVITAFPTSTTPNCTGD